MTLQISGPLLKNHPLWWPRLLLPCPLSVLQACARLLSNGFSNWIACVHYGLFVLEEVNEEVEKALLEVVAALQKTLSEPYHLPDKGPAHTQVHGRFQELFVELAPNTSSTPRKLTVYEGCWRQYSLVGKRVRSRHMTSSPNFECLSPVVATRRARGENLVAVSENEAKVVFYCCVWASSESWKGSGRFVAEVTGTVSRSPQLLSFGTVHDPHP
ncbi:hypothetical protein BT69DRAFT_1302086 [Atractiella rhizophila]|nr:hypothetical protein BT69DRAFT_1302086 [Atractiella rhizophila]